MALEGNEKCKKSQKIRNMIKTCDDEMVFFHLTCDFFFQTKSQKKKKFSSDDILINKCHKKLKLMFYVLQITVNNRYDLKYKQWLTF